MADVKISALPAASTPLTGAEVLPIVQSSTTKQVAVSNLTAGLSGTASININGTVGATTPTTGAFTSGTFSTTLGVTGVATLGNGAVLGTPASGTVTNLTGTASININGTVGATTPATGAFTSGTFSTTLVVNGNVTLGDAVGDVHTTNGLVQIGQGTFAARTGVKGVIAAGSDLGSIHCQLGTTGATFQWVNAANTTALVILSDNGTFAITGTLEVTGSATLGSIAGAAVATQANQETATSTTTAVSPGRQQFHPSAAKAWVRYQTVTTTTNIASYNVASLTDNGTGDTTITYTTNFSSGTSYNGVFSGRQDGNNINCVISAPANFASSTIRVTTFNLEATAQARDYEIVSGVMFGDQ